MTDDTVATPAAAIARLDPDALVSLEEERDFLLRSLEDLEREHAARRAAPIDGGHAETVVAVKILGELAGGGGFHAQVHLGGDDAREGGDDLDGLEAAQGWLHALDPFGGPQK